MAEPRILVAATSATFDYEGQPVWVVQGRTTVREGHPITKGRENLFTPLVVDFELPAAGKAASSRGTQAAGHSKPPAAQGKPS